MQLGWIDFSKTERSKVLSVLDMLSEDSTLDELGIAPIRDGFGDLFFPGTSTIQTRAKYFLVVPYALKQLELDKETNPNVVRKRFDEIERQCAEAFIALNQNEEGVIGKRSLQGGKWVKRTAADIYWAGLRRFGIFKGGNLSLWAYIARMCRFKVEKSKLVKQGNRNDTADEYEADDIGAGNIGTVNYWSIPTYSSQWQADLSMGLTKTEALFLKEKIITTCPDSMFAFILKNNIAEFRDCDSFESIASIIDKFPTDIQEDYRLALSFSEFIYFIRAYYNIIISKGKHQRAVAEVEKMKPELASIADIDIERIFARLRENNPKFNHPRLKKFIEKAKDCMLDDCNGLEECITQREVDLKRAVRAKTVNPSEAYANSDAFVGGGRLDYRRRVTRTLVDDIMTGEGNDNA